MSELVSRAELDEELAVLRATISDPRAGLFGPGTMVWEVAREAVIFLGAGRAALLQLAHPYVGSAIAQHSITMASPQARFQRTFRRIFRMVFGDLDEAMRSAVDVYRVHAHVRGPIPEAAGPFPRGHTYDARDREASVWVLATLWDTSLWLFDRVVRPLSRAERARYYEESRRFARLFGLERSLPPSYDAFEAYVARTLSSDVLTVTRAAAEIGRHIMRPDNVFGRVLRNDFGLFTAHLLPERLARGFGLDRGGAAGLRRFERILELARSAVPRLPPRLRYLPAYLDAERRLRGDSRRDRLGELMTRLYLGRP
ncbi:MAG: DUF2236 domain-containing protein [Polyangiaceae bacterium]|jgi:uncharacterized protein (DUF2236 family)|nr:DUF2236 domain-containing protein [Polyangiaceae bacterium]MBK8938544.1 DUF2236 domain-containing protein [Polyangiaceae bacterium]